jgi:hypothetical protein
MIPFLEDLAALVSALAFFVILVLVIDKGMGN